MGERGGKRRKWVVCRGNGRLEGETGWSKEEMGGQRRKWVGKGGNGEKKWRKGVKLVTQRQEMVSGTLALLSYL